MRRLLALKMLLTTLIFLTASGLQAEVRRQDEYVWRRAQSLAAGKKVFALQTSYQNFSRRYADDGRVQPLGKPFARTLTWNRLKAANSSSVAEIEDYMTKNGLKEDDVAATSSYEVGRQEIGFGLNFAYALTESWMVGILIPVRFVTTNVRRELNPRGSMTPAMRARLQQLADAELAESGFDQVPVQKQAWEVGDVTLFNQVELWRAYNWTWSLQQQVRFPTARSSHTSEYIGSIEDQGSMNLGLTSLLDWRWRRFVTGLRAGYVAQLPDTVRARAPSSKSSTVDPRTGRDLGDWLWGAVDGEYRVTRKVGVSAEHSFLSKSRDRYTGETFSADVYQRMADQTDQQLQQTRIGLLYKIGGAGTKLGERWLASVDYTYPWLGKNSAEAARTSFEIINYF